jgi:peptide/nickel transport system permease protein
MNDVNLLDKLQGPSAKYLLGTDELGRDILSRLIYGARVSMIIGLGATLFTEGLGITLGVVSGFIGGKVDLVIQRFVDVWMSIPSFLVLMTFMSIIGRGIFQIILVLGITVGVAHSRIMRSAVINIKSNSYVSAAEAIGSSPIRMMVRHILPNIVAPIIVNFTISIGGAIMAEASLSFLGLGVPLGVPSWGSMLSNEGRQYMEIAPLLSVWPGLALTIVVYGINMFGDALRDLLDPRLRGGVGRYTLKGNKLEKFRRKLTNH